MSGRTLLAVVALTAACSRAQEPTGPPLVELRDRQGERRLALWQTREGLRWTDRQEGAGRLETRGDGGLGGHDPRRGALAAERTRQGIQIRRGDGSTLRLQREGDLLRLGDGAGIPLARVRIDEEEAVVHDAGGVVTLRARRTGGRIVVTDREGSALAFVVGQVALPHAALATLSWWSAGERALLLGLPGL